MTEEQEFQPRDTSGWVRERQGSRIPRAICLYVITESQAEQPCKIGSAAEIGRRLSTLNSGNPRPLILRAMVEVAWMPAERWVPYQKRVLEMERSAQVHFGKLRIRGEWFAVHWEDARDFLRARYE